MRSRSYYFLLAVVALGALAGLIFWKTEYKLGLDVKGGVRFTYQVKPSDASKAQTQTSEQILQKTKTILQDRISSVTGVAEGTVAIKGDDQLIVEIPGYADIDKAREQIGTSASLKAYWAKNVRTENPAGQYRAYSEIGQSTKGAAASVDFENNFTHQELKAGDPASAAEYKRMIDGWDLLATGDQLENATANPLGNGNYEPDITFNGEAGEKIKQWSLLHKDQGEKLAFVLDNRVLEIAPVERGQILGAGVRISGTFTPEYVKNLVGLLNAGALPVDLQLLSSEKVDPTIGQSALNKMVMAGLIAFAVVSLFLIVYYAFPGFVAFIALMLYVLFTLAVLKLIGATFSLAAIAGFVLSVGMAVDANILVFERFKEEIKKGKKLHDALQLGFSRALPAIVDSNACSILTSLVLATLGTGPVKGFATTLIIGVLISLFTAVTVTRSLLFFLTDSGIGNNQKMYGLNRNWFGEHLESTANSKPLQIVNNSRKWFTITVLVIIPGLIFIGMGGLKPNVEFTGGSEFVFDRTASTPNSQTIVANLAKSGIKGANVQLASSDSAKGGAGLVYITIPGTQLKDQPAASRNGYVANAAGLGNVAARSYSDVGPTIQKETTNNAIFGILGSFALIVVYLGFRFGVALGSFKNGMRFGMSAIAAGLKDIVVILGFAAIVGYFAGWELSSLFLTAMLTVIGFSVHDKIVIFDRVRENLLHPLAGENFENLVNRSVTQSFARSINTAMTVVVTLGILFFFGTTTPDLKFFCLAMLAGIAWGTYSSIYTAAPVLYLWETYIAKKYGEDATLMASAVAEQAKNRVRPHAGSVVVDSPTPAGTPAAGARSYGQVRRRASSVTRSKSELDD